MIAFDRVPRRLADPRLLAVLGAVGLLLGGLAWRRRRHRHPDAPPAPLAVATRTSVGGDVESDDPAGTWADDGGGGMGGSQTAALPS